MTSDLQLKEAVLYALLNAVSINEAKAVLARRVPHTLIRDKVSVLKGRWS